MERQRGPRDRGKKVGEGGGRMDEQRKGHSEAGGGSGRRRACGSEGGSSRPRKGRRQRGEEQKESQEGEKGQERKEREGENKEEGEEKQREERAADETQEKPRSSLWEHGPRPRSRFQGENLTKSQEDCSKEEEKEEGQHRHYGGHGLLEWERERHFGGLPGDTAERRRGAVRRADNSQEDRQEVSGHPELSMVPGGARVLDELPRTPVVGSPGGGSTLGSAALQEPDGHEDAGTHGEGVSYSLLCPRLGHTGENSRNDGCDSSTSQVLGFHQSGSALQHCPENGTAACGALLSCELGGDAGGSANGSRGEEGGIGGAGEPVDGLELQPKRARPRERKREGRKRKEREVQRWKGQRRAERASSRRKEMRSGRLSERAQTMTPVAGERRAMAKAMKRRPGGTGGAVKLGVQPRAATEGSFSLREKVKTAISYAGSKDLSLLHVGSQLFQCMKSCCKSLSMAKGFPDVHTTVEPLADTVQGESAMDAWEGALLLALWHLSGENFSKTGGSFSTSEMRKSVREQLERFDVWGETFAVKTFEQFFSSKGIDYQGEEVKLAKDLIWDAVANSFPDNVGHLKLEEFCDLGVKDFVMDFEKYLLPEELQTRLKPPRVMVQEGEWHAVAKGLLSAGICEVIALEDVYQVDGQPVLNGLFAVGKDEYVGGLETQRLIMNLTPANALVRELKGDVCTLPMLSNLGLLLLGPEEQCLVSSEDVRCFFYLFRTPKTWHRFMAFNKQVDEDLKPPALRGKACVLTSVVLPMGFAASVGIAQHVHRKVINEATQRMMTPIKGEGEIRRDRAFPQKADRYRVYLDNFDQLEVVDQKLAAVLKGTVSDQVEAVREEYTSRGLPRHPKKGVSRQLRAEVQGSLLLGDVGIAIPKAQKILQYVGMGINLLAKGECKLKELQVVCGGFVYLTSFRKPLLCALNEVWAFMESMKDYPPVINFELPDKVVTEMVRFLCLVPLAQINMRTSVEGMVTCSDASQTGGGICFSTGLTPYGVIASQSMVRGDIPESHDFVQVLSVGLFDGISGLRMACDRLGLPMAGHISIEQDPKARRVVESHFPDALFHEDIRTLDEEIIREYSLRFSNVGVVIIGGGPPCQGVSGLNADRRGALKDHRSSLFAEVPRVVGIFRKVFCWAQVHELLESVASMGDEDRTIMSTAFEKLPWSIDAKGLALCRRPRLYWCTWELQANEGATLVPPETVNFWDYGVVTFDNMASSKGLLEPGWNLAGEHLPTFTTARPSATPGRKPAGLHTLSKEERRRWEEDWHRFPPYQYARQAGLVNRQGSWRLPSVVERELCMGFPSGYTRSCVGKQEQKGWEYENVRLTLLGNSWMVGVIVWLLSQLFAPLGLCTPVTARQIVEASQPGCDHLLQGLLLRPPLGAQHGRVAPGWEKQLVTKLLGLVSIKGEDLLIQPGTEPSVKHQRLRASIPAKLWKWRDVAGWLWRGDPEHINVLELRAVMTAVKWWIKKKKVQNTRFLHLVDSQVVLNCLSRGRTSSKKLRRTLMRINGLLLGSDLRPIWGYIHTSLNPADRPSRRGVRVKKKWVK